MGAYNNSGMPQMRFILHKQPCAWEIGD